MMVSSRQGARIAISALILISVLMTMSMHHYIIKIFLYNDSFHDVKDMTVVASGDDLLDEHDDEGDDREDKENTNILADGHDGIRNQKNHEDRIQNNTKEFHDENDTMQRSQSYKEQPILVNKYILQSERTPYKLIKPGEHYNIPNSTSRKDPDGNPNYVHNPKFLKDSPPNFTLSPNQKADLCQPMGYGVESSSIIHPQYAIRNIKKIRHHIESAATKKQKNVTLFCAVYTYSQHTHFTNAISETWGKKCDGVLYASDISNYTTGHMHLPANTKHDFTIRSMYQRVRTMKAYIYDNFLDDYDFFHFSGDDIFLIVENLKEFLASDRVQNWDQTEGKIAVSGFWTRWDNGKALRNFYLNGGPGYTLSRKALKAYVEGPLQICDKVDHKDESIEDIQFSTCLRMYNFTEENTFVDTRDEVGAHRYHSLNITSHSFPPFDTGIYMRIVMGQSLDYLEKKFGFPKLKNDEYIANSSVVFHRHENAMALRRMEMLLYRDIKEECSIVSNSERSNEKDDNGGILNKTDEGFKNDGDYKNCVQRRNQLMKQIEDAGIEANSLYEKARGAPFETKFPNMSPAQIEFSFHRMAMKALSRQIKMEKDLEILNCDIKQH